MRFSTLLVAGASLGVLAASPVMAADQAASTNEIQTVVVTAQKRTQALQDVPIVVNVVGSQLLKDTGVKDIKDLQILTPGLIVTSTSNETITTVRIRGVGTVGDNPGLESSVGIVIDGVYRPRNGVSFGDLGEVERIEVLKGPQGTLFGKSTSAGVVNIITAQPKFKFGADGEATFGNYGSKGFSGSVTGPIVEDKLAARIFVAARERDGFLNVVTGAGPRTESKDTDQSFYTVRGQLLWTPSADLDVKAIADYTKRDENCCSAVQTSVGTAANARNVLINTVRPGSIATTADPYARVAYSNRDTTQKIEDKGVSAEVNWKAPLGKVTSVTAYREWTSTNGQDSDFSAADIYYRPNDGRNAVGFKTFSEEARLAGEVGNLNWLVGAFYADEKLDKKDSLLYGTDYYSYFVGKVLGGAPALLGTTAATVFTPGSGDNDRYKQEDETFALFTNNTYQLNSKWDVTMGLRWTNDNKDVKSTYSTTGGYCAPALAGAAALAARVGAATAGAVVGGMCLTWENEQFNANLGTVSQHRSESEWSGTLKTAYRWTPTIMTYASYARGYKAGGFNLDRSELRTGPFTPVADTHFAPETVDSVELGAKTQWLNKTVTINAALFDQSYHDFQLNTFLGTTFVVKSLPAVRSKGIDIDGNWRTPVEGLVVQGGLTYAETQYANQRPAGDTDFCMPGDTTAPCGANAATGGSLWRLPGSRLSFAPLWSLTTSATYERSIPNTDLTFRANVGGKYLSSYNTGSDLASLKVQRGYGIVNARMGVGAKNGLWTVEVWGQNVFDEQYRQVTFNSPLQGTETDNSAIRTYAAFLGQPATYGVTLRAKY